jgi:hypothetical protein
MRKPVIPSFFPKMLFIIIFIQALIATQPIYGHVYYADHELGDLSGPDTFLVYHIRDGSTFRQDGERSNPWIFAAQAALPPGRATLVSPSGTLTDTTPTYKWNAVTDSTWYYLWVDDSSGNRIQQWYRASEAGCASGTGTCSATPDIKLVGGTAKWWIQTWNPAGYGPWSQGMSFTVSPPGAATLVSPSGAIWEAFPTFTWNAVLDSSWYYLKVDDSTGNRVQQWYRASEAGCASGTGTCSVKPVTKLQRGAGKFLVQTWSAGGTGPWSTAMNFTVTPATLVSPSGSTTDPTPTYTWKAVSGSTWYFLWVDDSRGTKIQQWYKATDAGCGSGTGSCSVTPAAPLTGGPAKWWIMTWINGAEGPWSPGMAFAVTPPPAATLISPSGTITATKPTYTWNAVQDSTWYYLWVDDSTGTRIQRWYRAKEAGCESGTGTCSVTPSTELAVGAAKWWIQTYSPAGYGPWSKAGSFQVRRGPSIEFTSVPPYGSFDLLKGRVYGVDPQGYAVAVYINVEDVWWTKPTYVSPLTPINGDGTWTCNITTGGYDQCAGKITAFLVPAGTSVPICGPCFDIPVIPQAVASAFIDRSPTPRVLSFGGYDWSVKRRDFPAGPGPNYFSDSPQDVWADNAGLHLTIRHDNERWFATEVISNQSFGYGTYRFVTNSRVDLLDPNIVLGLFTWETAAYQSSFRELDIEFARWSNPQEPTNAQFVVQPCSACPGCQSCSRFTVDLAGKSNQYLTNFIVWQAGRVEFRSYYGRYVDSLPPQSALVHKWVRTTGVPDHGNENVRMNLWLNQGAAPINGLETEVVINDFAWAAGVPDWPEEPRISIDGVSPLGDTNGNVWGHVEGVSPDDSAVAVYILVRGGWWTKPYWDMPKTPIQSDMTWICDITTGGVDPEATKVAAYLIPKSYDPPLASGEATLPPELETSSLAKAEITR